jgi:hypothetical protein
MQGKSNLKVPQVYLDFMNQIFEVRKVDKLTEEKFHL